MNPEDLFQRFLADVYGRALVDPVAIIALRRAFFAGIIRTLDAVQGNQDLIQSVYDQIAANQLYR